MAINLKKRTLRLIGWGIFIIIALAAVFYFVLTSGPEIPKEFLMARQDTAAISQKIASLTKETAEKIKVVNVSELTGDPDRALLLIKDAKESNRRAYDQATELAKSLQRLAESLNDIRGIEGQQLASQAIAIELSLVSDFIVYTQYLNKFFDNLTKAVSTNSFASRRNVEESIREVNGQVARINSLNKEFLVKMAEFDASFVK
ncbi:MAG: hypothetical protein QMD65_01510 [Patescibacteria group bacterium]|nr:hypothetical protein [Patescibacteria group bacterium]